MCRKEKHKKESKKQNKKQSHRGAVGLSLMALKSLSESAVLCVTCSGSVPGRCGRLHVPLQHVLVTRLVVVVPVVVEVRTVVGRRYQGQRAVVVVWVQWFLLNADVVHSWQG